MYSRIFSALLTISTLLMARPALAAPAGASSGALQTRGCHFVARSEVKELLSEMPKPVIGWVTCYEKHPEASVFIVARFTKAEKPDEAALKTFLLKHAERVVYDGKESKITWESNQPVERRQYLVRTVATLGNMSHFAFVAPSDDGGEIVFIHSQDEKATQRIHTQLDNLRSELSNPTFVGQLAAQ